MKWLTVKKYIQILGALAAMGVIYFVQPVKINRNGNADLSEKGGRLFYHDQEFTGIVYDRFPNQQVARKTSYKDGLMHGESDEFGFTGARIAKWNYKDGVKDGLQIGWYIEGPIKFEQNYKNGLLDGESKEWYINGNLFRARVFEKGAEVATKILYATNEIHTNFVKRDGGIYGLKSGDLCMDVAKDGEIR